MTLINNSQKDFALLTRRAFQVDFAVADNLTFAANQQKTRFKPLRCNGLERVLRIRKLLGIEDLYVGFFRFSYEFFYIPQGDILAAEINVQFFLDRFDDVIRVVAF